MTTTSGGGRALAALVRAHGDELHRLAAILTADPVRATELTAWALPQEGGPAPDRAVDSPVGDRLRTALVRRFLRTAPRRVERLSTPGGDAGDVLRRLSPLARAAATLRLVEGWDTERTASVLHVSGGRVEAIVPRTPGLELALVGLGDQHGLAGPDLHEALLEAVERGATVPGPRRRRWLVTAAAAALPAALLAGLATDGLREHGGGRTDGPTDGQAPPVTLAEDLSEAGWTLDDAGEPPRWPAGLHLRETVTVEAGRRTGTVSLPAVSGMGIAAFGVLWCDMPPSEDDNLEVPAGTLTVDGSQIRLPCAGRDGSPPVSRLVALPGGGRSTLEVSGDLPGKGSATLAVYTERDGYVVPHGASTGTDAPPVDDGSFALDAPAVPSTMLPGRIVVQAVEVGHESTLRIWAGRPGSVAVAVDGLPATDDGDVAATMRMAAAWDEAAEGVVDPPQPRDYADWSTQRADLRDGRWLVAVGGQVRTFDLPEELRPAPGERRTVVVETRTENLDDDDVQVVLTDARRGELDTSPVPAMAEPAAPELLLGHRLVGQWEVPGDGFRRDLLLTGDEQLPDDLVVLLARDVGEPPWFSWGQGVAGRGGGLAEVWLSGDLHQALRELRQPWFGPLPEGPGPLSVAAPPAVGHPPTTILAYAGVPYETFDFAAAAVPPDSWPAGSPPPDDLPGQMPAPTTPVAVIDPEDLEDGEVSVAAAELPGVRPGSRLVARVTTEGRGRMRFLVDDRPADMLWETDGWWSSWTGRPVTSDVELAFSGSSSRLVLRLVVQDYEDVTIELLTD